MPRRMLVQRVRLVTTGSVDTEPVKQIGYLTGVSGMSYASESVASLDGVKKPLREKPVIPELTSIMISVVRLQ